MATPCTYGSLLTYIPPLLFHAYQRCVKPLAANCFHITEQPGDLGGFPRPPTLGHGACTFANAYHQSHSGSAAPRAQADGRARGPAICDASACKTLFCHCLGNS